MSIDPEIIPTGSPELDTGFKSSDVNPHSVAYPAPEPGQGEPIRPDVKDEDLGYN